MADTTESAEVRIVPANEASWEDLQLVFGKRADPARCWCQRYKMQPRESWASVGPEELAFRLREQTDCDHPRSQSTSGLVAYLDDEPAGWCAVEPRSHYARLLRNTRVPWEGRSEDKTDDSVWAVTCLLTRVGFRRRRISYALADAAVDFARPRGARALEGYPITTTNVILSELHVGSRSAFAAAGFTEVSHPTFAKARSPFAPHLRCGRALGPRWLVHRNQAVNRPRLPRFRLLLPSRPPSRARGSSRRVAARPRSAARMAGSRLPTPALRDVPPPRDRTGLALERARPH